MTNTTIPAQLSIDTQALLDLYYQIDQAKIKDLQAGGSAAYYIAQLDRIKLILQWQDIIPLSFSLIDVDVPKSVSSDIPAKMIFQTKELLDLHWGLVATMEYKEKEETGSGSSALAQALLVGQVIKLGGISFTLPRDVPKSVN